MEEEAKKKVDPKEPDADDKPQKPGAKMPWDPKEPDDDDKKKNKAKKEEKMKCAVDEFRDISARRF